MNKEQKQAITEISQMTWAIYCDMLNKTGGNIKLALDLTGVALKAILQPQTQQPNNGSTFFMGEWGNEKDD